MADGMFQDERIVTFFINTKQLVDDCFHTLYNLTNSKAHSVRRMVDSTEIHTDTVHKAFSLGLDYILYNWDAKIKEEEYSAAISQFPNIVSDFGHCKKSAFYETSFIQDTFEHYTFKVFLYSYICMIANSKEMRNMHYFTTFNFADKDTFLKDLFRMTLVQSGLPPKPENCAKENENDNACNQSKCTRMSMTACAAAESAMLSLIAGGERKSGDGTKSTVVPDDSISNVFVISSTTKNHGRSKNMGKKRGHLTSSTLNRHDDRYRTRRTRTAATVNSDGGNPEAGQRAFTSVTHSQAHMSLTNINDPFMDSLASSAAYSSEDLNEHTMGPEYASVPHSPSIIDGHSEDDGDKFDAFHGAPMTLRELAARGSKEENDYIREIYISPPAS